MTDRPCYRLDKRWSHRRERWIPPAALFDPGGFAVDGISERAARALVAEHHYSGSFPAARFSAGLWRKRGVHPADLVGVAVFSVPMQQQVVTRYSGLPPAEGVELGRFVCTPDVLFNGETWFLKRAFALLRQEKPGLRAIVSYADPLERRTAAGLITKRAHAGQIYQGSNALYAGQAAARWIWLTRDGQVISERALSKIRSQDRGHVYAERQLIAAGADPRRCFEEPAEWLDRTLREPLFRRVRHPGNHAYVFGLDRAAKSLIASVNDGGQRYPRVAATAGPEAPLRAVLRGPDLFS